MTARTASRLAWSLWGAALVLLVAPVVLSVRADTLGDTGASSSCIRSSCSPSRPSARRSPRASRQRDRVGVHRDRPRLGGARAADGYAAYALATGQEASFAARAADWVNIWFYGPGIFLPVTLLLLLFPDGRFPRGDGDRSSGSRSLGNLGVLLGNAFGPPPTRSTRGS